MSDAGRVNAAGSCDLLPPYIYWNILLDKFCNCGKFASLPVWIKSNVSKYFLQVYKSVKIMSNAKGRYLALFYSIKMLLNSMIHHIRNL